MPFVLRFNVLVNNFSVVSERSHHFPSFSQYSGELMCLAQGHKTVPHVVMEPWTTRFGVRCSTTTPPSTQLIFAVAKSFFVCTDVSVYNFQSCTKGHNTITISGIEVRSGPLDSSVSDINFDK